MTTQELKAIEERCEKATPGPWTLEGEEFDSPRNIKAPSERQSRGWCYVAGLVNQHDAKFISNARSDIPTLLSHVKAQEEEIERLKTDNQEEFKKGYEAAILRYGMPLIKEPS